jgi:hypothetical protein
VDKASLVAMSWWVVAMAHRVTAVTLQSNQDRVKRVWVARFLLEQLSVPSAVATLT